MQRRKPGASPVFFRLLRTHHAADRGLYVVSRKLHGIGVTLYAMTSCAYRCGANFPGGDGAPRAGAGRAGILGRLLFRAACTALLLQAACAGAADDFAVSAEARGEAVAIEARATVAAPYAVVWGTLTDYGRLAEFIPGMQSSRIAGRSGTTAIVEQHGKAGFMIFSYGIDVLVASTELPSGVIEIHALEGNLKQLRGRYRVEQGGRQGTCVLRWTGLIEPVLALPHLVGVPMIRNSVAEQFRGMVDEIERRAVLAARS